MTSASKNTSQKVMLGRKETMEEEDSWKKWQKQVSGSLEEEKLRNAQASGDVEMLKKAIHDYETNCGSHGCRRNRAALSSAHRAVTVLEAKQGLERAMKGDPKQDSGMQIKHIESELEHIRDEKLYGHMQTEVQAAFRRLQELKRKQQMRGYILSLNKNTMSEMRRYHSPPGVVHKVMQAALLLVGEGEYRTCDWKYCCQLLNPQGQNGLLKKLVALQTGDINPEIAARSRELLSVTKLDSIQKISPGAGTFYVWAMGVVEEVFTNDGRTKDGKRPPANVNPADEYRQQEIFGHVHSPRRSPQARRKDLPANFGAGRGVEASHQVITYPLDDPPRSLKVTPPYPREGDEDQ